MAIICHYNINSIIIPAVTPIVYNVETILIFSFKFLFILNNTIIPSPEFTSSPPISVPSPITLLTNSSVNITEDAQFGISPISPAKIGPSIGLFKIKLAKVSFPITCNTRFKTIETISIKINIWIVCFIEDFIIPSSQWQCSCSHKLCMSSDFCSFFLNAKSIKRPAIIPITIFIATISRINPRFVPFEISIGSISSDVDRYIDISVP